MPDLFETERDAPAITAAHMLARQIASGQALTRAQINIAMTSAFGGSDAAGLWTQRESFEVCEHATVLALRAEPRDVLTTNDLQDAIALAARLPTQTVRSEEQIALQQFSTPVDLAALAIHLAAPIPEDIVLEPSAGNGLLLAHLPAVAQILLNEVDEHRRERLADAFPAAILSGHDGALIDTALAGHPRPTLVLMNPPFSRSQGRGADPHAAVRHLQAALRSLRGGGRCVAVMPDWFAPSERMREIFERAIEPVSVRQSIRLSHAFDKHGTGIAVRLYVMDKLPGARRPATIARERVADLLPDIAPANRMKIMAELLRAKAPPRSVSLFSHARRTPQAAPRVFRAPVRNDVLPVAYRSLAEPAPLAEQSGCYLPYRPSRLVFEAAGEHPTPLMESVAMGSIPAPLAGYVPRLPERTVAERLLSAAQLETAIYAGSAWEQWLPGAFRPDPEGVGLLLDEAGSRYRKGFFLGDGTGAGKGRQVAATILDQWLRGRCRAIWISKNEPLLEDARRDWQALGGLGADIQPLSRWKIHEPVTLAEGILFVSYPTLRSQRGDASRLEQLIAWAGEDFDGVIAFDESHEMGGVAGGEAGFGTSARSGSQQGVAGVLLQNRLPSARVLYASATGASEVNNLAYAVRLGLWGPETAFAGREQFIAQIRAGGIAAMELVARDLKATGLYMARALSFAGVEYDVLRHDLTCEQIAIYDTYAEAWAIIHRNMEAALEQTGVVDSIDGATLNAGAKAAARSRFESTKQRFFAQVLLSMKLPTVIEAVEAHLAAGQSVVLQLVTTAEAILDRRLAELSPGERASLDIDLSPREYVIDYLQRAFPVRQMECYTDDTDTVRSRPLFDAAGNPVFNAEAEAARDQLIEELCALPPIKACLDALLERFGHEHVAEVTGRTKRLVPTGQGGQKLETRTPRSCQADAAAFMDGTKRILVFSDAGGTGRSYHASLDVPNQQQRVHFLLEPGWRADRAIQGLGRTHRTHQASAPLFRPVTTNCKGELRFTSTIARRLDSLGALTRGQRQTGGQNLFDPADNLESEYAKAALLTWYRLLQDGKLVSTTFQAFQERTGLELTDSDGVLKEELPPIQRWLNRLLALPIGLQNAIFDEFLALVEERVQAAREAGTLDIGVETVPVESVSLLDDILLRTDTVSGATSHLLTLEIARRRTPTSLERVLRIAASAGMLASFQRNARSGKVGLVLPSHAGMAEDGSMIARAEMWRPLRREYWRVDELAETAWEECSRQAFEDAWTVEVDEAANRLDTDTVRLATGLLLPIWSALPADHLEVNRIVDDAGNAWLGRIVYPAAVGKLLKALGLERAVSLSAAEVAQGASSGGVVTLVQPFACEVKRVRVNGLQRIELAGAPAAQFPWLKSIGCFVEVVAYRSRVFIPVGEAEAVLARLLGEA